MSIDNQKHHEAHKELIEAGLVLVNSFDGVGSDGWMRGEVHSRDHGRLSKRINNSLASLKIEGPPKPSEAEVIDKIIAKLTAEAEKTSKWAEDRLLRRIAEEIKEGKF